MARGYFCLSECCTISLYVYLFAHTHLLLYSAGSSNIASDVCMYRGVRKASKRLGLFVNCKSRSVCDLQDRHRTLNHCKYSYVLRSLAPHLCKMRLRQLHDIPRNTNAPLKRKG